MNDFDIDEVIGLGCALGLIALFILIYGEYL